VRRQSPPLVAHLDVAVPGGNREHIETAPSHPVLEFVAGTIREPNEFVFLDVVGPAVDNPLPDNSLFNLSKQPGFLFDINIAGIFFYRRNGQDSPRNVSKVHVLVRDVCEPGGLFEKFVKFFPGAGAVVVDLEHAPAGFYQYPQNSLVEK